MGRIEPGYGGIGYFDSQGWHGMSKNDPADKRCAACGRVCKLDRQRKICPWCDESALIPVEELLTGPSGDAWQVLLTGPCESAEGLPSLAEGCVWARNVKTGDHCVFDPVALERFKP